MNSVDGYIRATFLRRQFSRRREFDLATLMEWCAHVFAGAMASADLNRIILSEGLE